MTGSSKSTTLGIAKERDGDAEPLAHPERVAPCQLAGDGREPDQLEDLVDPSPWDVVGLGEHAQVRIGASAGVHGLGLEERTDLAKRPGEIVELLPADRDGAVVRPGEPHDHAHRRGLARTVGPEESCDAPFVDLEREMIDGLLVAVAPCEFLGHDRRAPNAS